MTDEASDWAVDLFAGSGWGVALQILGIREHGVELMPEARATREANGMHTWLEDVWDVLEHTPADSPEFRAALLIASPPCQTFSMAGKGTGRAALDEVIEAIETEAYLDPAKLRAFGERHDPRTALVLTPLAYIAKHTPRVVILEQVPTVLPVWRAYATVLERWGYSVKVDVLNAEQFGVPQTRKRAILVARWDAEVQLPTPTHSRYYPQSPARLDAGVLPWVSMAEAVEVGASASLVSQYGTGHGVRAGQNGERRVDQPAATTTSKAYSNTWMEARPATTVAGDPRIWPPGHKVNQADIDRLGDQARERYGDRAGTKAVRLTIEQAAALQTYPVGFKFAGRKMSQFLQVGNAVPPLMAQRIIEAALR